MPLLRPLLFVHRYLAVAVGLLMALWCLSGFVMLYQEFPDFTRAERLGSLEPLAIGDCCNASFLPGDETSAGNFRIEMLLGRPVLRQDGTAPIDLRSGTPLPPLAIGDMLEVARGYAARRGTGGEPAWRGEVDVDQWTVQTAGLNRPAHHIRLQDDAGTELYVNASSGEIFQETTRRERVLAWLGAIPHWLYPTALRRNGPLWSGIVIWTSVIGTFLTATGLYVGIARLRRNAGRLTSPFRGWWYWHHLAGLVFGVLALTWVFSGLLTMNPWGLLLGSEVGGQVRQQLAGSFTTGELRHFLQAMPRLEAGPFTQLRAQPFAGRLFVLALRPDGSSQRLDAAARPAPLSDQAVRETLGGLSTGLRSLDLLTQGDAYYYGHKEPVELPVYRAILADAQATRVYISPTTGAHRTIDRDGRQARWWQRGLHGLDFDGLRARPLWDVVALLLLAGVTALCITGSWMAIGRVRRDFSRS